MGRVAYVSDVDKYAYNQIDRLGKTFRRVRHTPYLITSCGHWIISDNFPHITRHYSRNSRYRYLHTTDGISLHRMVGLAWCYNPCPGVFKVIDHIDGDSQNNDFKNLRWITQSLNGLNRVRKRWYEKKVKKSKGGKMCVWYQSRVQIKGKSIYGSSRTPEEAINTTKRLLNELFIKDYETTLEENPERPLRPAFMHCWTDRKDGPTMRDHLSYSGDGEHSEMRSAGFSL